MSDLNQDLFFIRSRADAALEIAGRIPVSVCWDAIENRMFSCEAKLLPQSEKQIAAEQASFRKHSSSDPQPQGVFIIA